MGKGKEQIVPRVPKIRREEADDEVAGIYTDYAQTVKQPDACISFMILAHFPALLRAKWNALKINLFEPGEVSKRIKEGISIIAAKELDCEA